jgi:hypothetical protein
MRDRRLTHFQTALESLAESLDATARICRWEGPDEIPEPLQQSAGKLIERLGAANRLTTGHLAGPPEVVARLTRIRAAIQRLDGAYVDYVHRIQAAHPEPAEAAAMLDLEICGAKTDAHADAQP